MFVKNKKLVNKNDLNFLGCSLHIFDPVDFGGLGFVSTDRDEPEGSGQRSDHLQDGHPPHPHQAQR